MCCYLKEAMIIANGNQYWFTILQPCAMHCIQCNECVHNNGMDAMSIEIQSQKKTPHKHIDSPTARMWIVGLELCTVYIE